MSLRARILPLSAPGNRDDRSRAIEDAVVGMYTRHPSPSHKDKLSYAAQRMELRLYCCGVDESDFVGRDVLDAGCGTGEYSSWFASHGANVTGIDLSDGSLSEAREYVERVGLRVDFQKRSVLKTGFRDNSFDLVYCTGVLHHTPDPFGGLTELHRVLRPGGKVLISLYNSFGFFPREVRRRIVLFLAGADLDKRVEWGRWLFPRTSKKLVRQHRNDDESALYDYFAIPHETLHSLGQTLAWFDRLGLEYKGCFAPAQLRDYGAVFGHQRFRGADRRMNKGLARMIGAWTGDRELLRRRPGPFSRFAVQMLWLMTTIPVFSMCAGKPGAASGGASKPPGSAVAGSG